MATFPATTVSEAVTLIIEDGNKFGNILRGDANTTVTVDGGTVPSVAKALQDAAAYKTPLAWDEGASETDLLQPRVLNGTLYAPLQVPVTMTSPPSNSDWRVFGIDVEDAPQDGSRYGRKNGEWVVDPIQTEAPVDSKNYARRNNNWVTSPEEAPVSGTNYVRKDGAWLADPLQEDAPSDGSKYARLNGDWSMIADGGGIPNAPIDGLAYRRKDDAWVADPVQVDAPSDGNQYARKDAAWVQVSAGGSALTITTLQTGTLTAFDVWLADVSSAPQTRALPLSPTDGDEVVIVDDKGNSATNNITVSRNGNLIQGLAEDLVIDVNYTRVYLKYNSPTTDWRIIMS